MTDLRVEIDSRESCGVSVSEMLSGVVRLVTGTSEIKYVFALNDKKVPKGVVRMDKIFASHLGIGHGDLVACTSEAGGVSNAPIIVRPASEDDWEVIESRATFIEDNLLGQIEVVFPGLRFPVWLGRGEKPVTFCVAECGEPFTVLGPESELAVEPRERKNFIIRPEVHAIHARVVDEGFPEELVAQGLGFLIHSTVDVFTSSVVTVRDRPDIIALVAGDRTHVDEGVVLVAPVMREKYGIRRGDRIVIEQLEESAENTPRIPRKISIFGTQKNDKSDLIDVLAKSVCLVLPQGGWLGLGGGFCRVQFDLDIKIALLAKDTISDVEIVFASEKNAKNIISSPANLPVLKYVPEECHGAVKLVNRDTVPLSPLPSFAPLADRLGRFFEACLSHASGTEFISSALVVGRGCRSGRQTVVLQAIRSLMPPVPSVTIDCAVLTADKAISNAAAADSITGLIRYAFETPPMVVVLIGVDKLFSDGQYFLRKIQSVLDEIRPNRSLVLVGTATEGVAEDALNRLFVLHKSLPKLGDEDRIFLKIPENDTSCPGVLSELLDWENKSIRKTLLGSHESVVRTHLPLGGMDAQFSLLHDAIALPLRFPLLFSRKKNLVSTGALVVGPSGTGKSALVDRVVRACGLPMEIVRGPDLLDKYIGASEEGVRKVFQKAASIAPAIVVFDAIEALCPRRGSESTGVTDRVVNQMLCYLDGVEALEGVFVIAVTSRPDMVDPALTRPGRLDLVVLCDIPSELQKGEIIKVLCEEFGLADVDQETVNRLAGIVGNNCTGADIRAGFISAKIACKRAAQNAVSLAALEKELASLRPAIPAKEQTLIDRIYSRYRGGPEVVPDHVGTKAMLR